MDDEQIPTKEPDPASPRSSRTRWLIAGAILVVVAGAAIALPVALNRDEPKHEITGTMTLTDNDSTFSIPCQGRGGYSDIQPGAGVTVTDGSSKILAVGELGIGAGALNVCTLSIDVPDVPKADFYKIEVSHRGGITYSFARLNAAGWKVELTLGP